MRNRSLLILVGLTLLVLAGAIATGVGRGGAAPDRRAGTAVIPDLAQQLGSAAKLTVAGPGAVTLARAGESWGVEQKAGYPADPAKIRSTLLGFAELRYVEPKSVKPEGWKRLEVEDPGSEGGKSRLVTILDEKGGKFAELIVGKRRPDRLGTGTDGLYVRRPGDSQSWLAQGSVDLPAEIKDWLDRRVAAIPGKSIREVKLTQPDGGSVVLSRAEAGGKLAIADLPEGQKPKADSTIAEPASVLDGLELSDVKPRAEVPFPPEQTAKAEWTTFDGLRITGETVKDGDLNWLRLVAAGEGEAAKEAEKLNAAWSKWAFAVYEYKAGAMRMKLQDLVEAPKGS